MKRLLLALTLVALTAPGVSGAARSHAFGSRSAGCGDDGTLSWTPTTLWPPNHKLHDITFTYADPDGGDVTLSVTAKPHSDTLTDGTELKGTGNTPAATDQVGGAGTDSDGSVDVLGKARAERSGMSWGARIYSFEYTATNDANGDGLEDDGCSSDVDDDTDDLIVTVPHDCRAGACKP